jgi:hypothetical protein
MAKFRFICLDSDVFAFRGTNDETLAREWAEDELVYDIETDKSLNADGSGEDAELDELTRPDGEE